MLGPGVVLREEEPMELAVDAAQQEVQETTDMMMSEREAMERDACRDHFRPGWRVARGTKTSGEKNEEYLDAVLMEVREFLAEDALPDDPGARVDRSSCSRRSRGKKKTGADAPSD